ncbi:MAG: decaprenylphospho-beta-D-erythro-pentofuranosid-2-ulose 2-reductase [Solirubrobacteraceae bacterium]
MKDALGSVQSVLVLGGGSDIALATVRALMRERARRVVLAAREPARLQAAVEELRRDGAEQVEAVAFDADDVDSHERVVGEAFERLGDVDLVLVAFGVLGDQERSLRDPAATRAVLHTNLLGAASALVPAAQRLRDQGHGTLVVLSSVAAERARRSNFVYGASKAGLDAFCQGLADELAPDGIHVLVVRPGMVRTKMTAGMDEVPFTTTPEAVAEAIVDGVRRGSHTVWAPSVLRWVFAVLRHLPRPVFRRLDL